ncbi:hypothetical protein RND81_14G169200 [Saponaria officinalis]|uniref:Uncharacterized protein n=1 Tax=Saponaria officinalis TaxID=3572 RepID=A0AAW1GRD6_SAPOF
MPNFITQLSQDTLPCVLMAMLGGLFWSLGNVSIQYAWPFVGLSVAQVITSSIAVVIGTSLNYFLDDKINKASILFPGVACFLTADILEDIEVGDLNAEENKKAGTAESIIAVENQRAIKVYTNLEGNRSNLVQISWAILSLIKAGQGTVDPIPIERGRDY